MSVYGLLLVASLLYFGARADCTRIFGLLLRHRFDAGPGYSRVSSQSLLRALRTWSLEGFANAGSTGLPLFGLLRNRGVDVLLLG